ncbi:MAG TPA: universal stress protein [Alphaproteobacteria bacterium]|nr:universal stress protein [Alphaproteobacteria bacterium]
MTIKDIVVHVDDSRNYEARIGVAIELAQRFDAHLTGVYVKSPAYLPAYVAAQVGPDVIEMQARASSEAAASASAGFEEATKKAGLSAEMRVGEGPLDEVVSLHARYGDLCIVGQTDPDGDAPADDVDVPGHVVLYSGRPVFIVPYAGRFNDVGKRVLVAWNGSREAARAVNDAMPFLKNAAQVTVLAVNPSDTRDPLGDLPGADISLHFARHGVKVEAAQIIADDIQVGDMLLSRISDGGYDMVVMGAYGRSRIRELVMGGASRHIMHHMTVPIFMAH